MFKNKERKPFGELTREQKLELLVHFLDNGTVCRHRPDFYDTTDSIFANREDMIYYIPDTKTVINWEYIHEDYIAYARDENGGGYLYSKVPFLDNTDNTKLYWAQGPGKYTCTSSQSNRVIKVGDEGWKDSLIIRPEYENND